MSWQWHDEELENKEYDIQGTVTISTNEYRDLIAQAYTLKAAGQKEHDDWYTEYKKREEFEKKVNDLTKKLDEINLWFEEDDASKTKFKLWKVEQIDKAKEIN